MADAFGDGWNSAKLHVYDLFGFHASYAPTNQYNPLKDVQYCFDPKTAQDGRTVSATVIGLGVQQPWEVRGTGGGGTKLMPTTFWDRSYATE